MVACTENKNDADIDKQLNNLLENKNYFKLHSELEKGKNKLPECRALYYQAYCNHVFNNTLESNQCIETLLNKNKLGDSIICELLGLRASNYIRTYQYNKAADTYKLMLEKYKHNLDNENIDNYENSYQLWSALANVEPQHIHKQNDVELKSYRNQYNHLMVPVNCKGVDNEFIFDTGANLSTITESMAKKMNLKLYESNIKVGTSTEIDVYTKLAVADSFYVENILFENLVFLVVPDEQMSFPQIDYYIHGIIGFPAIYEMGEIRISKNGTISIPKEPTNKQIHNLCMEGLRPIVKIQSGNDTLLLTFDTGANFTDLSKKYYENHSKYVEENGELVKSQRGSAGGITEVDEYLLKNFIFAIGTKTGVLPKIIVSLTEYSFNKNYDGNLGQDIITQFDEMILNFKYMYIDFN